MAASPKKLALVTPWFGPELKGGAEQQARNLATLLTQRGHDLEVLTTCCRSFHDDWGQNHLPEGLHQEQGLQVRRFKVDARNARRFDEANGRLLAVPRDRLLPGVPPQPADQAHAFCKHNINSTALQRYLEQHGTTCHAVIFMPYLYGPILHGLPLTPQRGLLQPCLHDEAYAYLPQVEKLFRLARRILYNSEGEMELALKLYGPGIHSKGRVMGEGVEIDQNAPAELPEHLGHAPFLLCAGRRDPTKNTPFLVEAFREYKRQSPDSELRLILIGPSGGDVVDFSDPAHGILDLGLVEERHKNGLLRHCRALVNPSRNESFSRVLFEAWFMGRPVAVNADCLATAQAVRACGGGWQARDGEQWRTLFAELETASDTEPARRGALGHEYARRFGDWESVIDRYEELFAELEPAPPVFPKTKFHGVHQMLPNMDFGDAISNQARTIRDHLRAMGLDSEILVKYCDAKTAKEVKLFKPKQLQGCDALIYHHSIGSPLTAHVLEFSGPKCLVYHNITPSRFFRSHRPEFADVLDKGREELARLAPNFPHSAGVSRYNAAELEAAGFANPRVLPIIVDPGQWNEPADAEWMRRLQDGATNILFVGRIAPNKRQDLLLRFMAAYLRLEPNARMLLVGGYDVGDPYFQQLLELRATLGLRDVVELPGKIDAAQLQACWRTAHLFLSCSEHEGFGVPLVEAMWFDVPVLALKSSAVPETLGQAALMLTEELDFTSASNLERLAALAEMVIHDPEVRAPLIAAQRRRRLDFTPSAVRPGLESLLQAMAEAGS